jgi:hypothetical protein
MQHPFLRISCGPQATLSPMPFMARSHKHEPSAARMNHPGTLWSAIGTTSCHWRSALAILFFLHLLCSTPALAATAPADTLQGPTPRGALLRSAIVPGWGQHYNKRPFKALFFATAAAGFLGTALIESRSLNQANTDKEHQDRAARRNTRVLLLIATSTFAALDAFVDAHLADLEVEPDLEIEPGGATLRLQIPWEP